MVRTLSKLGIEGNFFDLISDLFGNRHECQTYCWKRFPEINDKTAMPVLPTQI